MCIDAAMAQGGIWPSMRIACVRKLAYDGIPNRRQLSCRNAMNGVEGYAQSPGETYVV